MTDRTSRLIQTLTRNLQPVRRLPRLRVAVTLALLIAAVTGASLLAVDGLRADLPSMLRSSMGFSVIVVGLALVALGGVVAALATSVPGREPAARAGLIMGLVGVGLTTVVGSIFLLRGPAAFAPEPSYLADVNCLSVSCLLSLPPAIGVLAFISRAAPHRLLLTVLAAVTGTVALGALAVHLSCPCVGARHLILGHALAPAMGAMILTVPFHAALRRIRGA